MRQDGLWHADLVSLILSLRHHDTVVIADAGLPVPRGVPVIDLGWRRREPRLIPVLAAVLDELIVERAMIATEVTDKGFLAALRAHLQQVPVEQISHESLKARCGDAHVVVRTGEDTPYANVILDAGVPFGRTGALLQEGHAGDGHAT
jgi:D-ribose pyranase